MCPAFRSFWIVMALAATTAAWGADAVSTQRNLRNPFDKFLSKWTSGQEAACTALLPPHGDLTQSVVEERRVVPFGTPAHDAYITDFKQDGAFTTAKVRLYFLLPKPGDATQRELSVVEETFSLQSADGPAWINIHDFKSQVVTVEVLKGTQEMLDKLMLEFRNQQRSVAGRRQYGLIICSTLWQIAEPSRAWPLLREISEMKPTESISDLPTLQIITRKFVALEKPSVGNQELADRILAMKPDQ